MATTTNRAGTRASTTRRTGTSTPRRSNASTTTSTQPTTRVEHVQQLAERAVLVPVGAGLMVRDSLVSNVRGLTSKYTTRQGVERELKRYERRGATARNRFERDLRQRRKTVERTVKQNRRKLEREVRSVRKDFEKQSGSLTTRVEKLVDEAQGLLASVS